MDHIHTQTDTQMSAKWQPGIQPPEAMQQQPPASAAPPSSQHSQLHVPPLQRSAAMGTSGAAIAAFSASLSLSRVLSRVPSTNSISSTTPSPIPGFGSSSSASSSVSPDGLVLTLSTSRGSGSTTPTTLSPRSLGATPSPQPGTHTAAATSQALHQLHLRPTRVASAIEAAGETDCDDSENGEGEDIAEEDEAADPDDSMRSSPSNSGMSSSRAQLSSSGTAELDADPDSTANLDTLARVSAMFLAEEGGGVDRPGDSALFLAQPPLHRSRSHKSASNSSRAAAAAAAAVPRQLSDGARSRSHRRAHSASGPSGGAPAHSASTLKPKLPAGATKFNNSTYMSERTFLDYFRSCSTLAEAVAAIAADYPTYKSVSVYARARRMQLKFDGGGQLLLHGKRI